MNGTHADTTQVSAPKPKPNFRQSEYFERLSGRFSFGVKSGSCKYANLFRELFQSGGSTLTEDTTGRPQREQNTLIEPFHNRVQRFLFRFGTVTAKAFLCTDSGFVGLGLKETCVAMTSASFKNAHCPSS
jgi:hypothetical protein